jgi:subtilisin family serine protease
VHFDEGTTPESRETLIAELGGELVTWMHQINVAEIRLPVQESVTVASLPATGIVSHVEGDMVVSATYTPVDRDFSNKTMTYGLQQIEALEAWDIVTGTQQIVIAVIDSGVKLDHPEFVGRLVAGYDYINNDTVPNDDSGHGTHVAGIIAAALDNGEGIAGVRPNCALMPVKVLDENNLGSWSQLAKGILFAVDNGARILNLSLGSTSPSETMASAIDYALQSGTIVIAAAGNFNSDAPFYPASLEGVIAVGATTKKGERWAKSDYGGYIDLVAPGELIYSTYHDLDNVYHGYTYMSGTSMAAPFVSGVAGLLLSVAPILSAQNAQEALVLGTDDLGEAGWDPEFGYGRVNAMGALLSPVPGLVEAVGEITSPRQEGTIFLPILGKHE